MKTGILKGGLGTAVIEAVNNSDIEDVKVKTFGYNDCFVKHGSTLEIEKKYKLNQELIAKEIMESWITK